MITQERLKEVLNYDPITGVFTWKIQMGQRGTPGKIAGSPSKAQGYRVIQIDNKMYRAHRLAHLYMTGSFPPNDVDHKNHMRDKNVWSNLREVTRAQNSKNQTKYRNNSSGIMGVHWSNSERKYVAQISAKKKRIRLGCSLDFFEAICLRKSAEVKYNFHPNHGK